MFSIRSCIKIIFVVCQFKEDETFTAIENERQGDKQRNRDRDRQTDRIRFAT